MLDLRKVRLVIHILDKRGGILVFDNDMVAPKIGIAVDVVLFRDSYPVIQGPAVTFERKRGTLDGRGGQIFV